MRQKIENNKASVEITRELVLVRAASMWVTGDKFKK